MYTTNLITCEGLRIKVIFNEKKKRNYGINDISFKIRARTKSTNISLFLFSFKPSMTELKLDKICIYPYFIP